MSITLELEVPDAVADFRLPPGVDDRLHFLLDRQDSGIALTENERREAEGLVDLVEMLSLLRLKSQSKSGSAD